MKSRALLLMVIVATNIHLCAKQESQLMHQAENQKRQKKIKYALAAAGIVSAVTVGGVGLWYLLKIKCNNTPDIDSDFQNENISESGSISSGSASNSVFESEDESEESDHTSDSESDSNSESSSESTNSDSSNASDALDDMKQKLQKNLSSDLESFADFLLTMKNIYIIQEDALKKAVQEIGKSTQTEIESEQDDLRVIFTYQEPNEDTDGRMLKFGQFRVNTLFEDYTQNYRIEWRFPKKYCVE